MTTPIVDVSSALSHLRLTEDTITEDEWNDVERMTISATEWSESFCRRKWVTQEITETYTRFPTLPSEGILLPHGASSITSITYYDTDDVQQTWASDQYRLVVVNNRGYVYPAIGSDGWPTDCGEEYRNIVVTYDAGSTLANVPKSAINAVLLLVGAMYEYREDGVIDNAGLALVNVPVAATRLLSPYKLSL